MHKKIITFLGNNITQHFIYTCSWKFNITYHPCIPLLLHCQRGPNIIYPLLSRLEWHIIISALYLYPQWLVARRSQVLQHCLIQHSVSLLIFLCGTMTKSDRTITIQTWFRQHSAFSGKIQHCLLLVRR